MDKEKTEKEQQEFCLSAFIRAERQMLRKLGNKKKYTLCVMAGF